MKMIRWMLVSAITMVFSLIATNVAFAEGVWSGTTSSSDREECTEVCYSDGARWQYYEWPEGRTTPMYVSGASGGLTGGEYIGSCAEEGGYWRYAMIKHGTESPMLQIGLINVSGNTNAKFDDVRYNNDAGNGNYIYYTDNGESYYTYYGFSMGYVQQRYYEAKEAEKKKYGFNIKFTNDFYYLNGNWYGEGIAAFCGAKGDGESAETEPDPGPEEPEDPEVELSGDCGDWVDETRYLDSNSTEGWTNVLMKVNRGTGWQAGTIYAKPNETVSYKGCYYPGVQWLAKKEVTLVDGAHTRYGNTANSNTFLMDYVGSGWGNSYTIQVNGENAVHEEFENGDAKIQEYSKNYMVESGDVGRSRLETIVSSNPVHAKITPETHSWWCTPYGSCTHTNVFATGEVENGPVTGTAGVRVPFNFSNNVEIDLTNEIVYAGETATGANVVAKVGTKWNSEVRETYATIVKNAQVKVISYVRASDSTRGEIGAVDGLGWLCESQALLQYKDGKCAVSAEWAGDLNGDSNLDGADETVIASSEGVNAFDAEAGDYYCMVAAIYPATSGSDTSMDANGDGRWYVSAPKCRQVAKRPSLEVYGSLYAAGSVNTATSVKRNLGSNYSTGKDETTVFGSWVEQALIANGSVRGLASGASLADGSFEGRGLNFCEYRTPLSFANYSTSFASALCPSGEMVGKAGVEVGSFDGASLMERLEVELTEGDLALGAMVVGAEESYYVRVTGSVEINGNIEYREDLLHDLETAPKVVIFAGGDIVINCAVERVDAVLIAGGSVRTCGNYDGAGVVSSEVSERSVPLTIRGAVIAGQLVPGRVGGAGMGEESEISAEVIDYDSSVVEWGLSAEANESDAEVELVEAYRRELAPRL